MTFTASYSIVVMCSYAPLLMSGYYLQALHMGLLGVIITKLPLITYMVYYYTWSLKHSPLKAFPLVSTSGQWKGNKETKEKKEKANKQGTLGQAVINPGVWSVRNTKSILHHFVFWCGNTQEQVTHSCAHTHVCSGARSIAKQGHLSNAITFLLIHLIAYPSP